LDILLYFPLSHAIITIVVYIIKADTMPAKPSMTIQLTLMLIFAAEGFEDEEGLDVDEVELSLAVLLGEVVPDPVRLELANG